ncbi:hypothetical protein XH96_38845 [Bradyrhizobium sp. CCBAU 51765]|nr:hypothetical protein XH96_38845 [Bradyrhizobium sp. CCBAU 51765]
MNFAEVVMPGLVPGIHVLCATWKGVDGRDKPGHDAVETVGAHSHISYAIPLSASGGGSPLPMPLHSTHHMRSPCLEGEGKSAADSWLMMLE